MTGNSYRKNLTESLLLAVIVFFTFFLLSPVLKNGFQMHWDDQMHVVNNPYITSWSPDYLFKIFTTTYGYQYSPVNTLYWLIIHSLFGLNPSAFHGASLLLHLVNVVLVYFFAKKILLKSYDYVASVSISSVATLIFAIHPIQVEQYPKIRPVLPEEYRNIYTTHYLDNREGKGIVGTMVRWMESWMHRRVAADVSDKQINPETLEIGAGNLNHLPYEPGISNYDVAEPFLELMQSSGNNKRVRNAFTGIINVKELIKYKPKRKEVHGTAD